MRQVLLNTFSNSFHDFEEFGRRNRRHECGISDILKADENGKIVVKITFDNNNL